MTERLPTLQERIFAIDPGPEQSAYVWGNRDLMDGAIMPNEELLRTFDCWRQDKSLPRPDWVVIERIQALGMSVGQETFDTAHWAGRFHQAAVDTGIAVDGMFRKDIKIEICGVHRAKDNNVRQALIDRYGGKSRAIGLKATPGPLYGFSSHMWAALAVFEAFVDTRLTSRY